MIPGGKFVRSDGVQWSIFPSLQINVFQNPLPPGFTHSGTHAIDNSCVSGKKDLYAPFDVVCASKGTWGDGSVFYQSVNPVMTPSGLTHVSILLIHDNNSDRWEVGKIYKQGEHIYTEGTAGEAYGAHVHMDVAFGHVAHLVQNPNTGNWGIANPTFVDKVFFANHTEMLRGNALPPNIGDYVLYWQYYEDVINYIVSFNSNGGSPVASQTVEENKTAKRPKNPIREGYLFVDWFYNGVIYDFSRPVKSDLTLKAEWKLIPKNDIIPLYMVDILRGGFNGGF